MEMEILSGYATADYLLVAEPHAALRDEIGKLKKDFAEKYDCAAAATGKPNITLVRFEQYVMLEQKIVHRLELIARAHSSFLVEVNGFESLPAHSIFLNVVTKSQIVELVKSLRPIQHLLKIDKDRKPHFITEPHISIATKLLPWQYEKGWLELSNTHFSGKFMVEDLLLLRKRDGEKRFEVVKRFGLLNERKTVTQCELFDSPPAPSLLRKEGVAGYSK